MAEFDDRITIEIAPTNRYLRLWMATWRAGRMSGSTHPLPRHLLAERLQALVEQRLEMHDRAQDAAESAMTDERRRDRSQAPGDD